MNEITGSLCPDISPDSQDQNTDIVQLKLSVCSLEKIGVIYRILYELPEVV